MLYVEMRGVGMDEVLAGGAGEVAGAGGTSGGRGAASREKTGMIATGGRCLQHQAGGMGTLGGGV